MNFEFNWKTTSELPLHLPSFPLVFDLDGTFVKEESAEFFFHKTLTEAPWKLFPILINALFANGNLRVRVKRELIRQFPNGTSLLTAREPLIRLAKVWSSTKHLDVCLATGAPAELAKKILEIYPLFDRAMGSQKTNLIREAKARALCNLYGPKKFIYIGNSAQDIPVWEKAAVGVFVGTEVEAQRLLKKGAQFQFGLKTEGGKDGV